MKIVNGSTVSVSYRLLDADGDVVETTEPDEPLTYVHGSEDMLPALQKELEGAEVGSEHRIEVSCEESFGDLDPDLLITVPRDEFPEDAEIVPGDIIAVQVSPEEGDEDGDGEEQGDQIEMQVIDISADGIILDGNHPLAGQDVIFELKVLDIK